MYVNSKSLLFTMETIFVTKIPGKIIFKPDDLKTYLNQITRINTNIFIKKIVILLEKETSPYKFMNQCFIIFVTSCIT